MRFKDKVCVITGAAAGIGKQIAMEFAQEGAKICLLDVQEEVLQATKQEIMGSTGNENVETFVVNVVNLKEVELCVNKIIDNNSRIDILVNNAGITRDNLFLRMSEDDWDKVIAINLKGVFNLSKAAIKFMLKQKSGKIVNIASIIGIMGNAGQANYAASKAGVIALTKSIAKEVGSRSINVNAVAPGFIKTKMTDALKDEIRQKMLEAIPLRRFGEPHDVARLVLFLASDDASYIQGQTIVIDGGMH